MWLTRGKVNGATVDDSSNGMRNDIRVSSREDNGVTTKLMFGHSHGLNLQFSISNFSPCNGANAAVPQGLSADEPIYEFGQTEWTRVWSKKIFPRMIPLDTQQLQQAEDKVSKPSDSLSRPACTKTLRGSPTRGSVISLGKNESTLLRGDSVKVPVSQVPVSREPISRVPISRMPVRKRLGWNKGVTSPNANVITLSRSRSIDDKNKDELRRNRNPCNLEKISDAMVEPLNLCQNGKSFQKHNIFQSRALSITSKASTPLRGSAREITPNFFCDEGTSDSWEERQRRSRRKMRFGSGSNNDFCGALSVKGSTDSLKGQQRTRDVSFALGSSRSIKKLDEITAPRKASMIIRLGGKKSCLLKGDNGDERKAAFWWGKPIVIDGTSVAYTYGENFYFDWEGIHICAEYFVGCGCQNITVVVPEEKLEPGMGKNDHYVEQLRKNRTLNMLTCWSNENYQQFVLKTANKNQAVIISNKTLKNRANKTSPETMKLTNKIFGFRFNTNTSPPNFVVFTSP